MQEYGGYIEFESYEGSLLHDKAIPLNCGRSALAYLCEAKHIQKLYLPYFICSSVPHLLEKIGVNYAYYHIDSDFKPHFEEELGADALPICISSISTVRWAMRSLLAGKSDMAV